MKTVNIGINGFGRIGRTFFRLLQNHPNLKVVAINDLADTKTLSHLLKYDSIHGIMNSSISYDDQHIIVEKEAIKLTNQKHPKEINWTAQKVDIVVECSGKFKTKESLDYHLKNGAKKVILSVPPIDEAIKMIVYGINEGTLTKNDLCGIEQAYITTIHSYTSDQSLHDQPHRDLRRARAASQSIVPTTTGAAKALTRIFPDLADVIGGCGIRVPVPNGSLTDITFNVKRNITIKEINDTFEKSADNELKDILFYTEDPIVSIDINNSSHSCTFDSQMTSVIGKMVKIIGWYDNETGYSSRIIDLIHFMNNKEYI